VYVELSKQLSTVVLAITGKGMKDDEYRWAHEVQDELSVKAKRAALGSE
jgi:hypothetical protein